MKLRSLRRGLSLLFLSAVLLSALSCTPASAGSSADSYIKGAHRIRAAFEIDGACYEGIITVHEGLGVRDGEILYTAPAALSGVRAVRAGDQVTLTLGDAAITGNGELASAVAALDFFRIGGGITQEERDGRRRLLRGKDWLTVLEEYTA